MTLSKYGYFEIIESEAVGLSKYLDNAGIETISVGITKVDVRDLDKWPWNKVITIAEAMELYKKGMSKYSDIVDKYIKVGIKQYQYDALVSIAYNIGEGNFKNSTFVKRINNKDSLDNIKKAIMLFTMSTDPKTKTLVKNQGLVNRRTREANLYVNGTYNNKEGMALVTPIVNKYPKYSLGKEVDITQYFTEAEKPAPIIPVADKIEQVVKESNVEPSLQQELITIIKDWINTNVGKL